MRNKGDAGNLPRMPGQFFGPLCGQLDQVDRLPGSSRCQPLPIIAKCKRMDYLLRVRLAIDLLAAIDVPHLYFTRIATRRKEFAVRAEGNCIHPSALS